MDKVANMSMCLIVKNEPMLEECILSFREYVKELVIIDTGSTDGKTVEIARKYADKFEIYTACNDPITGNIENFAQARNRSLELATYEWCCWADADDLVVGAENFSKFVSSITIPPELDAISVMFPYEYSYDPEGNCTLRHYRERLFSNKNHFKVVNAVHEVFTAKPNVKIQLISDDSITWKHRRQFSNKPMEPGRNLRILKKYIEGEGKGDARQLYYIGLEYANSGLIKEAIENLTTYIDVSGWDDERVMACLKLVDIHHMLGQLQEGIKWGFKAVELNENWGEGYFALGKMFYLLATAGGINAMRNWQRCVHFIKLGLSFPPTKTLLFINPLERDHEIHKYLNVALNSIGDVKGALESVNTGLVRKDDPMLAGNKKLYEKFLANQQILGAINQLKDGNHIKPEAAELISNIIHNKVSIDDLLHPKQFSSLPLEMVPCGMPYFLGIEKIFETKTDKLDIVFYCGPGVEDWMPTSVEREGIGGSELMALNLAKRLAKLGHKVRLYNSCGSNEGIYDGVAYIQYPKFRDLTCDVLVVSRRADMLDDQYNISTKIKLLWCHDIWALSATNKLLLKADRILALSEWHKQFLINHHNLHEKHIIQTRNGIDLNRFKKNVKRDQFKCINASSPDRSLPILLHIWPRIKARVPQATLTIAYGFKNWEFGAQNDQLQKDLIQRLKNQLEDLKPMGINFIGRINQERLAEEYLSAGVLLYPTFFTETSYLGGMECQAAGVRFVGSSIAAINETVGNRGVLIDGEWTSQGYQDKFVDAAVQALLYENNEDRELVQQYAQEHFCLDKLTKDWEKMFFNLIEEFKINPIVPYQSTKAYQ